MQSSSISVRKVSCYRKFICRIFCQGNAYCVADSLRKQGGYTDGRLYSSSVSVASLCNSKVEREDDTSLLHLIGQQAISLDHNKSVTCL